MVLTAANAALIQRAATVQLAVTIRMAESFGLAVWVGVAVRWVRYGCNGCNVWDGSNG
jgi:hypothetical protein